MFEVLLGVFDTAYLAIATYFVAIALVLLAAVAPSRGALMRQSGDSASPLWLLLPAFVSAGVLVLGKRELLALTVGGNTFPVMFLVQVMVSAWVLWRNRGFPWLVVLSALALCWIQWSFFLAAEVARPG